ncbi:MAG: hypothetical protein JWN80_1198 [Microbacteriaceae bacterium]|nr:hypothetical protein [Microbacteriaceae bacterium]
MDFDRFGDGVVDDNRGRRSLSVAPDIEATSGLEVEHGESGFYGLVRGVEGRLVRVEDFDGLVRVFPLGSGFLVDGASATLVAPKAAATGTARTASGSFAVGDQRARVALPSRIFVEGRHDAELVEKVWGADLRVEGIVVEYLGGIDDLEVIVRDFAPTADRRLGVLVDHLVAGSKESRIADSIISPHVLVVGHPFVDVWQGVKPSRLGWAEWPVIPRSVEWKHGICEALGWSHADQADIAAAWQRILATVRSYADLEPVLLARVEQLIDFVTAS